MFGSYRLMLAILVVLAHVWPEMSDWTGIYAVFAFYMLSGYLMSLVLNNRYRNGVRGIIAYGKNRVLRIYPPYCFVLMISILLVYSNPSLSREVNSVLRLPVDLFGWLSNFFIIGLNGYTYRLVPPAWSLHVEIIFYMLLPFFAISKKKSLYMFIFSSILTLSFLFINASFETRYFSIYGAAWPFTLGVIAYHFGDRLPRFRNEVFVWLFLIIVYLLISQFLLKDAKLHGFYGSTLAFAGFTVALSRLNGTTLPRRVFQFDGFCGNLAYPVFLCHWHVLIGLLSIFPYAEFSGVERFFLTLIASIGLGFIIHLIVERPIENIRRKIRESVANPKKYRFGAAG